MSEMIRSVRKRVWCLRHLETDNWQKCQQAYIPSYSAWMKIVILHSIGFHVHQSSNTGETENFTLWEVASYAPRPHA